ncbi:SMI1/KNR4 family protein [Chondromyces crocatus]|uniref:Knr4/Smi1-like domain-containing protein n=1 Tax=Chondromyces crocatus TaxID=52 RepID=A0A0K1EK54_CHOCO|nr:SMI1/KNR4 family protein [Chondromyces crocatus]AKT40978.1 uncharacterized protein CMC5_051350 [Chondromyces crocatus]
MREASDTGEASDASWERIEGFLGQRAPEVLSALSQGASEEGLARLEAGIGATLPDELKASLRRHAGSSRALFESWELHTLEAIGSTWSMLRGFLDDGTFPSEGSPLVQVEGPLRQVWWSPGWIPIAGNGAGDHLCVDLDPAEGGTRGQVLVYLHDHEKRSVLFTGFGAFLRTLADGVTQGEIVAIEDGHGELFGIWPRAAFASLGQRGFDTTGWAIRPREEEPVVVAAKPAPEDDGRKLLDLLLRKGALVLVPGTDRKALATGLGKIVRRTTAPEERAAAACAWLEGRAGVDELFISDEEMAEVLKVW